MTRLPTNQWQALKNSDPLPSAIRATAKRPSLLSVAGYGVLVAGTVVAAQMAGPVASALPTTSVQGATALPMPQAAEENVRSSTSTSPTKAAPNLPPPKRELLLAIELDQLPSPTPGVTPSLWQEILRRSR